MRKRLRAKKKFYAPFRYTTPPTPDDMDRAPCYGGSMNGRSMEIVGSRLAACSILVLAGQALAKSCIDHAIYKISLACMVKIRGRVFEDVRLAAGSVAPVVIGLRETEAYLKGRRIRKNVIEKARRLAMDEVTPIDDVRSTALYRRTVTGNLVARFLGAL